MTICSECGRDFPDEEVVRCRECGKPYCRDCADEEESMSELGICPDCEETWEAGDEEE
jgi:rRNA maturation endonuclease Nob1